MSDDRAELEGRVKEAKEIAARCQAEAAVYRGLLKECRELAARAVGMKDWSLVEKIGQKTRNADETTTEETGQRLLNSFWADKAWLTRMHQSLQSVRAAAAQLAVEESSQNAELKEAILAAVEVGLTPQL